MEVLTIYHSVRQTDINRILMKVSQQDLQIFLSSFVCVPVNTVRVKNTGIIGQVWKQLNHIARDGKKESKEAISAGQYQTLCHHQSQSNYFQIPLQIIT